MRLKKQYGQPEPRAGLGHHQGHHYCSCWHACWSVGRDSWRSPAESDNLILQYRGEEFVIEKGGEAMCRILPLPGTLRGSTAIELASVIRRLPKPNSVYLKQVETRARNQPKVPKSPWGR